MSKTYAERLREMAHERKPMNEFLVSVANNLDEYENEIRRLHFIVAHVEEHHPEALPPSSPEAGAYGGGFDPYNP